MLLRLDIHCMQIWHWFWCKLIKFCRMSSNNFTLTLLFTFSLCKVIWLFMYTQISLFLSAFSLHIAIASLIACSFAFIMMILSETLVALLHLTSSYVNITVILTRAEIHAIDNSDLSKHMIYQTSQMIASQVKNRKSKFFALMQIKIDDETRVHQRKRKNHQFRQ